MRLKHLHIVSEYKNLKDFRLDFEGDSFIDVFVGKNGTGKSNFFEAIIEIFRHLYEFPLYPINFDYSVKYEINNNMVEIIWDNAKLKINGKERKTIGKTSLPDNVLIYYSGHNTKVTDLVKAYEKKFQEKIKSSDIKDTRKFIGIGKDYKQLLLASILLQPDDNKAKEFIKTKLGIKSSSKELKVVLKRPFFATNKNNDIDLGNPNTYYWHSKGITKDFLKRLSTCDLSTANKGGNPTGYFNSEDKKHPDKYLYYLDIEKIQKEFENELKEIPQYFFKNFDNLKTLEMLEEITLPVELENNKEANLDFFSDGQFQSVYIYSIIELFKEKNCLTLLDEPDSFLHPEWQFEFLKQVFEITDKNGINNHILLSSHSAVTLIPHYQKKIKLFSFKDKKLCCYSVNKSHAIEQLSDRLMTYSEHEQIINILNTITLEKKPVFFTEGSSDPLIITEAWQKLYSDPMPFIPIYAFNCEYLRRLLQDERIFKELSGKPVFGLFDFDEAYNEWNYLKGQRIETDPYKGLLISIENKNSYAFMLPVPDNVEIEKQVIKDKSKNETFLHESRMGIEHLFYGDTNTHSYFNKENTAGGGSIIIFKGDKVNFAKNIAPKIDKNYFEIFRPMFEFIKSKCKPVSTTEPKIVKIGQVSKKKKND